MLCTCVVVSVGTPISQVLFLQKYESGPAPNLSKHPVKLPLNNRVTMTHRVVSAVPPGARAVFAHRLGPF